jgi:hypothetical protein
LFKTYFKLNSISLSKNILKAIQAYRGDMPPLESFPKAHQVTFKYYVGVIYFLEENYVEVSLPPSTNETSLIYCASVRKEPHRSMDIMPQRFHPQ